MACRSRQSIRCRDFTAARPCFEAWAEHWNRRPICSTRTSRVPAICSMPCARVPLTTVWRRQTGLPPSRLESDSMGAGRLGVGGVPLGHVGRHPGAGGSGPGADLVPLHKLSQWLTYSLIEPLQSTGLVITELDPLTGLAEYRNGGLFVDTGVLVPRHDAVVREAHRPGDEVVVEWRALTVALLDRLAPLV